MGMKVAKFGGTSVADAGQLRKVQSIVRENADRFPAQWDPKLGIHVT